MKKILSICVFSLLFIPSFSSAADISIFRGINIWQNAYCDSRVVTSTDPNDPKLEIATSVKHVAQIGEDQGPPGPCDFCDAVIIASNVMKYAFQLIFFVLFPIFFAWGGIQFMMSAGNPGKLKSARQILISTAVGLAIAAAAWLIVGLLFNVLAGFSGNTLSITPWQSITCN